MHKSVIKAVTMLVFGLMSAQFLFAQIKADEYPKLINDDQSARLDAFAALLREQDKSKGLIFTYKQEREPLGRFLRHLYGVKLYLSRSQNINPDRLVLLTGEAKERKTELWIIPEGKSLPTLKSISIEKELSKKIRKTTVFDTHCMDCDPVVFLDLPVFKEGLEFYSAALKANPGSTALIVIGETASQKERNKVSREIFKGLKDNQIDKNRIEIRFNKKSSFTNFYVVPKISKRKTK